MTLTVGLLLGALAVMVWLTLDWHFIAWFGGIIAAAVLVGAAVDFVLR